MPSLVQVERYLLTCHRYIAGARQLADAELSISLKHAIPRSRIGGFSGHSSAPESPRAFWRLARVKAKKRGSPRGLNRIGWGYQYAIRGKTGGAK